MLFGMIPKFLHLFWTAPPGVDASLPGDVEKHVQAWRGLHPDFEVQLWDSETVRSTLATFPNFALDALFDVCRFEAMKSDIVRLALVYRFGGVYSDLKNKPLRPFLDDLTDRDHAIITEHPPSIPDNRGMACNAFLAGPPRHPFFLLFLGLVAENISKRMPESVAAVSGNGCLKRVRYRLNEQGRNDELEIIPSETAWSNPGKQDGWMVRTSISYNRGMTAHWSVRQKTEGLYLS
jgi:mannosyltransferase OCH1-like enzyme